MTAGSISKKRVPAYAEAGSTRHDEQIRYYRLFTPYPEEIPVRLAGKTVCVLGLGGIGSELVRHLSVSGVGRLICIDGDVVEVSNLNRQLWFGPADVGLPKARCLAHRVALFAPQTQVSPIHTYIQSGAELRQAIGQPCDFIACCADEPIGMIEVICLRVAEELGIQAGVAAMHLRRGYWGVFPDCNAALAACQLFLDAAAMADVEKRKPIRGSASWTNAIIAAFFAEAVIAVLAGLPYSGSNRLLAYDFDHMRAETTAIFDSGEAIKP